MANLQSVTTTEGKLNARLKQEAVIHQVAKTTSTPLPHFIGQRALHGVTHEISRWDNGR